MVLVDRYLRLLGVERTPPGIDSLNELVQRHLCRVPFENVSKLLLVGREGAGRSVALEEFLDGIEHLDLGGTCYSANPFLAWLLGELGYDACLMGADMSKPDVHTSIRVRRDGREYHVDVGYGGPFYRPIALDRLPHEIVEGPLRYVFGTAGDGSYSMSVFSGSERRHGYVVHGPPRPRGYFDPIVLGSFQPGQTFLGCLRVVRHFTDHAVELTNTRLARHRGAGSVETTLRNMSELRAAVENELAMPRCPIEEAVAVLERLTGRPFFEIGNYAA